MQDRKKLLLMRKSYQLILQFDRHNMEQDLHEDVLKIYAVGCYAGKAMQVQNTGKVFKYLER